MNKYILMLSTLAAVCYLLAIVLALLDPPLHDNGYRIYSAGSSIAPGETVRIVPPFNEEAFVGGVIWYTGFSPRTSNIDWTAADVHEYNPRGYTPVEIEEMLNP